MTPTTVSLEVCMRTLLPAEVQARQREVLDRVEALAADGVVDDVAVPWWSDRVCPPEEDSPLGSSCPEVVRDLLAVADDRDLTLAPYFERHARLGRGDADALVLPVTALVVRDGDSIVGLYPIAHEGRTYTVEDCLVALERGETAANLPVRVAD